MSLIANALKAAQQEKDKRARGEIEPERRVRSVIGDAQARGLSAPHAGGRAPAVPLVALIALGGLVAAGGLALFLFTRDAPAPGMRTAARDFPAIEQPTEVGPAPAAELSYEELESDPAFADEPEPSAAQQPERPRPAAASRSDEDDDGEAPPPAAQQPRSAPRRLPAAAQEPPRLPGVPVAQNETRPAGFQLSVDVPAEDLSRLLQRAVAAQRRGEPLVAIDLYERAVAVGAGSAEIFNNLGVAYRAVNDLARARDAYRRALALDSRDANAWSNLGVVMDALGETDQARGAYQEALKVDPAHVGAKVNLARHYHATKLFDEARRLLQQAIQTDPLLAEAHYALARVMEEQGDRAGALRHYQNFLSTHGGRFPREEASVRVRIDLLTRGRP